MNANQSVLDIIRLLLKRSKLIIGLSAVAAVIAAGISLIIPNEYESTARFKPYNLNAFDRSVLFNPEGSDRLVNIFGDKTDINRILPLANSPNLHQHLIHKFNLMEHYDIDATEELADFNVARELQGRYNIIKTEFDDIELNISDRNPQMAADLANEITRWIDSVNVSLVKIRNSKVMESAKKQFEKKKAELSQLNTKLQAIKDTAKAEYKLLYTRSEKEQEEYLGYKKLVEQYSAILENDFSTLYIIEKAAPAIKKSKPVRWLIVVISSLVVFFLITALVILSAKLNELKQKL